MRLLDRTYLLLLVAMLAWTSPAWAKRGDSARPAPPPKEAVHHATVKLSDSERRKTADLAKQEVMDKAQRYVAGWLLQIRPSARWEPSLEFLKRNGVIREPVADSPEFVANVGESLYAASVDVDINAQAQAEMLREVRHAEAWDRQLAIAKAALGILLVLAGIAGYFWFDDLSKGYYTHWLRLAVIGLLFVAGYYLASMPDFRELFSSG